jgi:5-methylcytosine-specific restriction endonuclease McrA
MRIPTDISLSKYIRQLIKINKVEKFYQTDDWKELRLDVLEFFHYECQECLKKGIYTRAECVHHINEVRHRPELALSRTYIDEHGQTQYNLIPLCNTCHNVIHEKLTKWKQKDKFKNEERW